MKTLHCPFCDERIEKGMSLYDHWCDYDEFDEVGRMLSDILEHRHRVQKQKNETNTY